MSEESQSIQSLEDRYQHLYKEYSKKVRKLQKSRRSADARAYVQQRLREEAALTDSVIQNADDSGRHQDEHELMTKKKSKHDRSAKQKHDGLCKSKYLDNKFVVPLKPSCTENKASDIPTRQDDPSKTKHLKESSSSVVARNTQKPPTDDCSAAVDRACNEDKDILDTSAESQDIFISPVKPVDHNKLTNPPDIDIDSDLVLLESKNGECIGNTERFRTKGQISKLKLIKYKKKNLVNPVCKENIHTKNNTQTVIREPGDVGRHRSDLGTSGYGGTKSVDGSEACSKPANRLCEDWKYGRQNSCQVIEDYPLKNNALENEQGAVYKKGQVIVFERQVTIEEDKNQKMSENARIDKIEDIRESSKRLETTSVDASLTNSDSQSSFAPSPLTLFDDNNPSQGENKGKIRRRSGQRKRHSSGEGVQRRSSRLSGQSSQELWSQSTESSTVSPLFINAGQTSAKKRVIISSVFQCLVDEGRRKNEVEEFCVPMEFLKSGYKNRRHSESTTNSKDMNLHSTESCMINVEKEHIEFSKTNSDKLILPENSKTGIKLPVDVKPIKLPENGSENSEHVSEKEEIGSPALFESQSDDSSFQFSKDIDKSETGVYEGTEQPQSKKDHQNKMVNSATKYDVHVPSLESNISSEESNIPSLESNALPSLANTEVDSVDKEKESCSCLQQTACFQVPKSDILQSVLCVVTLCNDGIQTYVVCLCSTCLKLYTVCNNQWTCVATSKLGFVSRKKAGNVMYCVPDSDNVSVIVLGMKSDCTCINMYRYVNKEWQHTTVDKIFSKSIQVCPLSLHGIVVSFFTDQTTYLCKYSLDKEIGHWSSKQMDRTDKCITQLFIVKGIEAAVLVMTKSAQVQIWNHEHGYLLSTVDISDVCPPDPACPLAFAEKGFLFLPLLTRKKGPVPGSVVVINPCMSTSEVLTSIHMRDPWTGCGNTFVMSDSLLVCRQNNGCVRVWNVYTGSLLATVDDVTVTCFSAANQHIAIAHKQCIHLYKFNRESLS